MLAEPIMRTLILLVVFISAVLSRAADVPLSTTQLKELYSSIYSEIAPQAGASESDIREKYGLPRGATTPEREKQNGNYDKDSLGLYRWFYRTELYWTEEGSGLDGANSVELVVYFIDGKVVGSTLKLPSPLSGFTFISPQGVTPTYSGSPPVFRKQPDGDLKLDFHVEEGEYDYLRRLKSTLTAYRDHWRKRWAAKKPDKALG